VQDLKKHFPASSGAFRKASSMVRAVDGVSFEIFEGETLGLVGESGCGKTTTGRAVLRLIEPTSGKVVFHLDNAAVDLTALSSQALTRFRRHLSIIFQDPYASLNPRMLVKQIVGEPLVAHGLARGKALELRVAELLESVGLQSKYMKRYPHEFSGGQRQRIGIARALALGPKLVIADESVSALDVSVQAQVLNLLSDLQREFGLAYLFIAHDMSVVEHMSDRVAVMYLGRIVELAGADRLYRAPRHPYTEALMSAVPVIGPRTGPSRIVLKGDVPSPADPPTGCHFHPRCLYAKPVCSAEEPPLQEMTPGSGHFAACHFAGDLQLRGR